MKIHESAEDYLEKILMLQEQKGSVRSIDIAVAILAVAVWLLVRPNKYENVNEVSVDTRKLIRSKS